MDKKELDRIGRLIDRVKRAGAGQADAFYEWGRNTEITARNGEVENLTQAVSNGVGLRVFYENRLGFGYTSDLSDKGLQDLADRVFAIAKETAVDENNGLPDISLWRERGKTPDVFDSQVESLGNDWMLNTSIEMEKAALAYDKRIKTCEEVGAGNNIARVALLNSDGLIDHYQKSYVWIYAVVVAEQDDDKQSNWKVDYATHFADLRDPSWIAQQACQKALRMLGAQKTETAAMPVVFESDMTKALLSNILEAINGDLIYKKSSFLLDKLGTQVASPLVTIVDDGTLDRRISSKPFDGEGLPTKRQPVIDRGILKRYMYDNYTAKKASAKPTGTAGRSYNSLPSIGSTNFYMEAGKTAAADLLKGIDKGLLVTSMMGSGANVVNGEYSRGAGGILIENGELTKPVQSITVSGNMLDMLADIDAVGDDLDWRGGSGAPSIRFGKLTVSGK